MNRTKIKRKLLEIGVAPNVKGFEYIVRAIEIILEGSNVPICKGIYLAIAEEYGVSKENVERCIRYCCGTISEEFKKDFKNKQNSYILYRIAFMLEEENER